MKITDAVVRGTTLPAGKTDAIFFDAQLVGFGLRVRLASKGVTKAFIVQYRDDLGATRRMILGTTAEMNAAKARGLAADKLAAIRHGNFPHVERASRTAAAEVERDRGRETFGVLSERFLKHQEAKLRPRSFVGVAGHVARHWAPLHRVSVHAITRRDVALRLGEITEKSGPVAANHARSTLSAFFVWALKEGLVENNPVANTHKHTVVPRDRVLTMTEIAAIWRACDDNDFGRCVKLLALTAQRRDEVGGLRWSEIDEDGWTLPAVRSKNKDKHHIPLAPAALALLPLRGTADHLFGKSGFANWAKAKKALDLKLSKEGGEGAQEWRLHDLRRSAATHMAELGVAPHIVETILNHRKGGVAGIYNRAVYGAEVRRALLLWADHLSAVVNGTDHKVVPLHRAG